MSMMKVYAPQIKITAIKSQPRSKVVPGIQATQNVYNQSDAIDLTPFIGDGSVVACTLSTKQPCGGFTIRLLDKIHPKYADSLAGILAPMDFVEIRMGHGQLRDGKPALIMRGFVSSITRSETMDGSGRPTRTVTITGHSMAKILQTIRINYRYGSETSVFQLQEFKFMHAFAKDGVNKTMSANDFLTSVIYTTVNKYLQQLHALSIPESVGAENLNYWNVVSIIPGTVSTSYINSVADDTLYNVLKKALDIGLFNEMFLVDEEVGPTLICRQMPYRTAVDTWIDPNAVTTEISISSSDIVSQTGTISDENVVNYYWLTNHYMSLMSNADQKEIALGSHPETIDQTKYMNSLGTVYGLRQIEEDMYLGHEKALNSDAAKENNVKAEGMAFRNWIGDRRKLLIKFNKDAAIFETKTLRIRGNESIKAGMYVNVPRGINQQLSYSGYCHTLTHEFVYGQGFFTTLQLDRCTDWITRAQSKQSPYALEIEGGVR